MRVVQLHGDHDVFVGAFLRQNLSNAIGVVPNYDAVALCYGGPCVYAEPFLDCSGNCENDADGDGICDELENPCAGQGCCGEGTLWDPISERCWPDDNCPADINRDGVVDALDVLGLIAGYGVACP